MRHTFRALFATVVIFAAVGSSAQASVHVSHSGWAWGDPRPQGDTLNAVELAGSTGYAAGQFGTLLKTADGGRTWQGIQTGLTEPLSRIRQLGADSVVIAGGCALRRSDDGGRSFRRLPWTASDDRCTGGIVSMDFPSETVGFLVLGNGNVLRSTDSGRTWSRRTAVPGTSATSSDSQVQPTEMDFVSNTSGFVATTGGNIFSTVDAGSTWTPVVDQPFTIRSLHFPTPSAGYAVGDAPFALATTDGGAHWSQQPLPEDTPSLSEVRCAGASACLAVSRLGDRLVRTDDGGSTWTTLEASTTRLRSVALASPSRAVAVGDFGTTVVSDDGGRTFTPIGDRLAGNLLGVVASSSTVAYAYGHGGALARTIDGGETWTEIDAATSDDLRAVSYTSLDVGFVLDATGQLLRTDNAGESWQILNTGTAQRPEALRAIDSRRVLLVGPVGIRRSDDGGQTFKPNTQRAVRRKLLFDVDRRGHSVLAYGPKALLLSSDDGRRWRPMRRPSAATRVDVADLLSSRDAVLLDAEGRLYFTHDAGRRWVQDLALGTEVGYNVHFSDSRHGWVAVTEFGSNSGGWVLRTDDGGATWQPQLVSEHRLASAGLAAPTATTGFALTRESQLLATHQGGAAGARSSLRISSPTARVRRAGDAVRIDGRLRGARGGEHVVVSFRQTGSPRWLFQDAVVASNGTFTVVARIRRAAYFVAQWAGNQDRRGSGTPALRIGAARR